jgi:hypothetical protein
MSIINVNHKNIMNKLINLPVATIVGNGRSGTDFLHSLFDSHPEVLTFNGHFPFNDFFGESSHSISFFDSIVVIKKRIIEKPYTLLAVKHGSHHLKKKISIFSRLVRKIKSKRIIGIID